MQILPACSVSIYIELDTAAGGGGSPGYRSAEEGFAEDSRGQGGEILRRGGSGGSHEGFFFLFFFGGGGDWGLGTVYMVG